MRIDIYEWSIQHNKWVAKRHIDLPVEKIDKILSQGYTESKECYKHVLEDGRVILHVNPEFFEREV